ncbi:early nodulin-like protein 17 [Carex rostrata]
MVLAYRRSILPSLRLVLLVVVVASAGLAVTNADKFTIKWFPNINYTDWEKNNTVHVGDWLVFQYTANQADVMQVNESAFNKCDATNPISNYSRGRGYAVQLNESKHYYFICSLGYCYGGMKLSVVAHPLPPPSPPPSSMSVSRAIAGVKPSLGSFVAAATVTALAMLLLLVS